MSKKSTVANTKPNSVREAKPSEKAAIAKAKAKSKDEAAAPWTDYTALTEIFIPGSDDDIDRLAADYAAAHQAEKSAKETKTRIGPQLESACMLAGVERLLTTEGGLRVRRTTSSQPSRISKEKLLDAGVELDVVESCTIPGAEYSYVQIDKVEE